MLTTKEIKRLTEYLIIAFKDVFATKDDINRIEKKIDTLKTTVDGLSKEKKTNNDERVIANYRLKKIEEWVEVVAPKVGVKFEQ